MFHGQTKSNEICGHKSFFVFMAYLTAEMATLQKAFFAPGPNVAIGIIHAGNGEPCIMEDEGFVPTEGKLRNDLIVTAASFTLLNTATSKYRGTMQGRSPTKIVLERRTDATRRILCILRAIYSNVYTNGVQVQLSLLVHNDGTTHN